MHSFLKKSTKDCSKTIHRWFSSRISPEKAEKIQYRKKFSSNLSIFSVYAIFVGTQKFVYTCFISRNNKQRTIKKDKQLIFGGISLGTDNRHQTARYRINQLLQFLLRDLFPLWTVEFPGFVLISKLFALCASFELFTQVLDGIQIRWLCGGWSKTRSLWRRNHALINLDERATWGKPCFGSLSCMKIHLPRKACCEYGKIWS